MKFLNAINILASGKIGALAKIQTKFKGDWQRAWNSDLRKYLPSDLNYEKAKRVLDPDKAYQRLIAEKIGIITLSDKRYPGPLKQISDPPFILYVRGDKLALKSKCFAVVGTRAITEYGRRAAPMVTRDLARAGFTIVSGLAAGVDTLAHKTALEEGGKTIAVLGCGVDDRTIFPPQNLGLAGKIIESGGALISEYAPGVHGTKFSFPQRNRIISGLAKGVLVVEADIKSGALITAKCALDQNRDVFAVPGGIFSKTSQGANYMIQKGAKLVASGQDILDDYQIYLDKKDKVIKGDSEIENRILDLLRQQPLTADDIIRRVKLEAPVVNAALTVMEIKRKVKNLDGKFVLNL